MSEGNDPIQSVQFHGGTNSRHLAALQLSWAEQLDRVRSATASVSSPYFFMDVRNRPFAEGKSRTLLPRVPWARNAAIVLLGLSVVILVLLYTTYGSFPLFVQNINKNGSNITLPGSLLVPVFVLASVLLLLLWRSQQANRAKEALQATVLVGILNSAEKVNKYKGGSFSLITSYSFESPQTKAVKGLTEYQPGVYGRMSESWTGTLKDRFVYLLYWNDDHVELL